MNTMEIINLDIDSQWKQHEMPFSVDAHCSVRLGNKIIVTGGWDGHSVSKLNLQIVHETKKRYNVECDVTL